MILINRDCIWLQPRRSKITNENAKIFEKIYIIYLKYINFDIFFNFNKNQKKNSMNYLTTIYKTFWGIKAHFCNLKKSLSVFGLF